MSPGFVINLILLLSIKLILINFGSREKTKRRTIDGGGQQPRETPVNGGKYGSIESIFIKSNLA